MLKYTGVVTILLMLCAVAGSPAPLNAGNERPAETEEANKPDTPEDETPAFTFDGRIEKGEYENATKVEFKIWNKQTALAYFLNSGKYLIVAFDVPERCLPESCVALYLDTRRNGGSDPGGDDLALKFYPEAVERTRFTHMRGKYDEWDGVQARGWMARANQALPERWQCEMIIDLDALGIPHGKEVVVNAALRIIGAQGSGVTDYPEDADTTAPQTWTLEVPLPGVELAGVKIELDPEDITRLQERERKAVKTFEKFYEELSDAQVKQVTRITEVEGKLAAISSAYQDALRADNRKKAEIQRREYMKAMREKIKVFTERAKAYEVLPARLDEVIKQMGSERAEVYDYQATLFLNLFQTDPSSYTTGRGARCVEYYLKALRVNPNVVNIPKLRSLMQLGCIREAAQLVEARLELEPDNRELRLLGAICNLRTGDFRKSAETLEKLLKEQTEDTKLLGEIRQHVRWMGAAEALHEKEQEKIKKDAKADDLPRVELDTTRGKIIIELFEDDAPNTVKNFVSLVQKRFYDGTMFHRVEGWVVQGGDPEECGMGGPGYSIKSEPNGRKHFPGYVGMARSNLDTEGSQFYFMRYYSPFLDDREFTVFARVIEGMDVLDKIERMDVIKKATVIRKRDKTTYEPVKN